MDINNIQALIAQGLLTDVASVDPNKAYVAVGVFQPGNRQAGPAGNAYPSYAMPISEFLAAGGIYTASNGIALVGNDFQLASLNVSQFTNDANYIAGTGVIGYVPRWDLTDTLGNSIIFDDGLGNVGVSTITPSAKLHVQGSGSTSATSALKVENSLSRNLLSLRDDNVSSIGDFNYTSFFQVRGVGGDVNIQSDTNLLFFEIRPAAVNSLMSFSKGSSGTDVFATVDSSRGNWVFGNLATSFNIQDTTTKIKIIGTDATSSNYALKVDNSALAPLLYVKNDGNTNINGRVGIGAVSSDEALFITNTNGDNARIRLVNQLAGGAFSQYSNATTGLAGYQNGVVAGYGFLGTYGAIDLRIRTNSVEHSIIKSNGNWGIGTLAPVTSALLDLTSTTGALLIPRMTTTEKNALTATNGMMLYDTTLDKFQGYEAGAWVNLV